MEYKEIKQQEKAFSNFLEEASEYLSWKNEKCYKQFGTFEWYLLQCEKLKVKNIKCNNSYYYEAQGAGFSLDYVEGDVILKFELMTREEAESAEALEFLEFRKHENRISITQCAFNVEKTMLFGCWYQDGEDWEILGYVPEKAED